MKVLQVIHGYPPRYNAGSEIYTRTIAQGLVRAGHEVSVFSREEDPFRIDYVMREERDADEPRISVHLVNMPRARDRFCHKAVDLRFGELADLFHPDVVHVGHLNHLSTSVIEEAHRRGLPVVFTIHDYWLMCPRGQFIQFNLKGSEPWPLCDGQDDRKCATHCYTRYYPGDDEEEQEDIRYWELWVHRRMAQVRRIAGMIDLFIAPSRTVLRKFRDEFGIPAERLVYLDYGFDHDQFGPRNRQSEGGFVFGYIGTHKPAKGIQLLLDTFPRVRGEVRLRIWGRFDSQVTTVLREQARRLPSSHSQRVEWPGEYGTRTIVREVFDRIDALVVPSIWLENSPLVIHEAQQARVPIITANLGGMAEYVHHEVNGLLFKPRDASSLAQQMQRFVDDPALAERLGDRGYLYSETGDIPPLEQHIEGLATLYTQVLAQQEMAS